MVPWVNETDKPALEIQARGGNGVVNFQDEVISSVKQQAIPRRALGPAVLQLQGRSTPNVESRQGQDDVVAKCMSNQQRNTW